MAERTESSITVDAAPADVLAVIADLGSYPEWARAVKDVEVLSSRAGRPLQARFVVDSGPIKDTQVLEYTWPTGKTGTGTVSWRLVEADITSKLDGAYELKKADAGTSVTYRLAVDVRIPMLGMLKRKAEKVIIDTALKELKKRVEG
ncbi:MAG TPA: SRPBCC family protein [Actinomycetales bacterium]|nr:SRPBCC family protein [Actinomycetales bacterium]